MLTFGSLFAGIGASISIFGIEPYQSFIHHRYGNFFKLNMPNCVRPSFADDKVFWSVVVFIQIYVMNNFTFFQRSTACLSCYQNMLCNISAFVCIRVSWHQNVIVSVTKRGTLSALPFRFRNQHATATPVSVPVATLVALGGYASFDTHLPHRLPNDFLRCLVLGCYFRLRHAKNFVVMKKLLFSEWNAVCVLVAHAGIISNASDYRKEAISC